jgi:hypothetical protein
LVWPKLPIEPEVEDVLTMTPPFSRIHLNTGWVTAEGALEMHLDHPVPVGFLGLGKVSSSRMPALLTRISARPKFLMASSNTDCRRDGRDVGTVGDRPAALFLDRIDHLLRHRDVGAGTVAGTAEVVDHDRRASRANSLA